MVLSETTFFSSSLHRPTPMIVLLPENSRPKGILYFLHGYSDSYRSSLINSRIENYFEEASIAIVFPDAGNSFYQDYDGINQYWAYVSAEIPQVVNRVYGFDFDRDNSYVGGISMGGFGALKLALNYPERFCKVFLFSPVTDIIEVCENGFDLTIDPNAPRKEDMNLTEIFNLSSIHNSENDFFAILSTKDCASLPEMYFYSGKNDFVFKDLERFILLAQNRNAKYKTMFIDGIHCWDTWEKLIPFMAEEIKKKYE